MTNFKRKLTSLFPPYLNGGSEGAAVLYLKRLLRKLALEHDDFTAYLVRLKKPLPPLTEGDEYDESTEAWVRAFQMFRGCTGADVDGYFGPATRALMAKLGDEYNVFLVTLETYEGPITTYWVGEDGDGGEWPEPMLPAAA